MTEAALRVGIVGCGRLAAVAYGPAIAGSGAVKLVGVADPDRERARAVAAIAAPGERPQVYAGAAELVDAGGVDAVIVASPVTDHLPSAAAVASAGLPCLVEKPPAPDRARAQALADLVPAPWIGFNRRFVHGPVLARARGAECELALELELRYRRASWRPYAAGDDALLDLGPHLADLALGLGGGSAEIVAADLAPERFALELRTGRGPAVLRGATDRAYRERVVARGTGFAASSDLGGVVDGVWARVTRRVHPLIASISAQLEAFAAAARGGDPGPLATAAEGVIAMSLVDEARSLAA